MNQLNGIAQVLAAQGRGGDTILLHITPKELAYLQLVAKKHGRTITINPRTGLPEASGLGDLIGPLLGIGLSIFAPELSPMMSGLISGAVGGIASGNLEKGLFGGLLGGGLNSLMGGLGSMGTSAPDVVSPTVDPSLSAVTYSPDQQILQAPMQQSNPVTGYQEDVWGNPIAATPATSSPTAIPSNQIQSEPYAKTASDTELGNYDTNMYAPPSDFPQTASPRNISLSSLGSGLKAAFDEPGKFYDENKKGLLTAGIGGLGLLASGAVPKNAVNKNPSALPPGWIPYSGYDSVNRPASVGGYPNYYDPNRIIGSGVPSSIGNAFPTRLSTGGIATYRKGKQVHFAPMPDAISEKGHHRSITQALRAMYESKASASSDLTNPDSPVSKMGIAGVHDPILRKAFKNAPPVAMAAGGRFVDGPGDGLSDSVRANIEGKQEARLADGEFVFPADAVSDLGNGSSKAGAKKLMAVVHHVRKKRHGTTKQPGPV